MSIAARQSVLAISLVVVFTWPFVAQGQIVNNSGDSIFTNGNILLNNTGKYSGYIGQTAQNNTNANYSASAILATGGCTVASPCEMNTAYGTYFGNYSFRSTMGLAYPLAGMAAQIPASHTSSSRPAALYFYTTPIGATIATERMRIDYTGNIGIGTTSPATPLDIGTNVSMTTPNLRLNGYSSDNANGGGGIEMGNAAGLYMRLFRTNQNNFEIST